jgi:hypothetical protein
MARAGTSLQKVQFHIQHAQGATTTATAAADCWIYLFRQQKVATFAHEIYIDGNSKYHEVSLVEHHGKDRRPYSKAGQDWAFVQAVKESSGKPPEAVPYWILFSPFQLTWSRLCEPGAWKAGSLQLADGSKFMTWARNKRALQWKAVESKKGTDVYQLKLPTPWHLAFAIADQFEAAIREYEYRIADQQRIQERHLLGMLNGLRASETKSLEQGHRPASRIEENLNLTEVWRVERDIKDDKHVWNRCESLADDLVRELEKPPFSPIMDDLQASHDIKDRRADHAMVPILARLHECLGKTKVGHDYLSRFVKKNLPLILWQEQRLFEFSEEEDGFTHTDLGEFKHGRKSVKSYWYFVKAYVEHVDKGNPARMTEAVRWWAKNVYNVDIFLAPHPTVAGVWQFDRTSVWQLQRASTKALSKVAFFGVLDTLYMVYTAKKALAAFKKDGGYAGGKALLSLVSAVTSAVSAGLSVVEVMTMKPDRFAAVAASLAEKPAPGMLATPAQAAARVTDLHYLEYEAAVARKLQRAAGVAHSKFGKALGATGALFEIFTGTWNAWEEFTTGDVDAAICHGLSAVGGALVMLGFILLATGVGTVFGAALIFAGNVLSLVTTLLATYFDDNDLEEWVKFSCFGKMNKEIGIVARHKHPDWAAPFSLAEFATRLDVQAVALERILFKLEAVCDIEYDYFTVIVTCRFAVKESRLWLALEVTDDVGRTSLVHPFSPWHDFKYDPTSGRVRKVFNQKGVRAVKVTVQLDIFGDKKLMHPRTPAEVHGKHEVPLGSAEGM